LDRIAQLMNMDETVAETQARALIERYQLRGMLITCGGAGAWWLERAGEKISIAPGKAVDVVDTVGAGDAFSAVFIFGLLQGWAMSITLKRAQQFAEYGEPFPNATIFTNRSSGSGQWTVRRRMKELYVLMLSLHGLIRGN